MVTEKILAIPIVTKRLIIRQPIRRDMWEWAALYQDPKVRLHMNGPLLRSANKWWQGLRSQTGTFKALSIALRDTGEFVGACGFREGISSDEWEVWIQLRAKFWGDGFGTEITSTLVKTAFESFEESPKRVIGIVAPTHQASLNMLSKLGFTYIRDYQDEPVGWQNGHRIYGIERA